MSSPSMRLRRIEGRRAKRCRGESTAQHALAQTTHPVFAQPLNPPSLPLRGKEGIKILVCSSPSMRRRRREGRPAQRSRGESTERERSLGVPASPRSGFTLILHRH